MVQGVFMRQSLLQGQHRSQLCPLRTKAFARPSRSTRRIESAAQPSQRYLVPAICAVHLLKLSLPLLYTASRAINIGLLLTSSGHPLRFKAMSITRNAMYCCQINEYKNDQGCFGNAAAARPHARETSALMPWLAIAEAYSWIPSRRELVACQRISKTPVCRGISS